MWSLALIIGVAVACSVVLLVAGVVLAISIERRRHRCLTQGHGRARSLSNYHKAQLSANENNYTHVPQPKSTPRNSPQLCQSKFPTWDANSSQERLRPQELANQDQDDQEEPNRAPKRRRSLRQTIYGHSFYVPKTRRQKKIQKAISLRQVPRSPLSAITEFTDSSSTNSPVTSQFPPSDKIVPLSQSNRGSVVRHSLHEWPLPGANSSIESNGSTIRKVVARVDSATRTINARNSTISEQAHALGPRSISITSTVSTAPDGPLPPVPAAHSTHFSIMEDPKWRFSAASVDTIGSSVLGAAINSPRLTFEQAGAGIKANSGIQNFDFGLIGRRSSAIVSPPPGKQISHAFCNGWPGITSTHPSFEFDSFKNQPQAQFPSIQNVTTIPKTEALKTIDASSWNPGSTFALKPMNASLGKRTRHSMYEGDNRTERQFSTSFNKPSAFVDSKRLSHCLPQRPLSVADTAAINAEQCWSPNSNRYSWVPQDNTKKGHRRQNCVRITNLPTVEPNRTNRLGHVPELSEDSTKEASFESKARKSIPNNMKTETLRDQNEGKSEAQMEVLVRNQSVRVALTSLPAAAYAQQDNTSNSRGIPRSDSDVFGPTPTEKQTPSIFVTPSPHRWPLPPNTPDGTKLASRFSENIRSPFDSPTLPTPILTSDMLFPRKSEVKGPRQLPVTGRSPRLPYPSPTKRHVSTKAKASGSDLRRSVMLFRSLNSEGRLRDSNSRLYRNLGDESPKTQKSSSPSRQSSPLTATTGNVAKVDINNSSKIAMLDVNQDSKKVTVSPSTMSLGAASIWEDASVRGDSPEPEMPPVKFVQQVIKQQPQTPKKVSFQHDLEAHENNIDYNTSPKHWASKNIFTSPGGVGLGLRVGNAIYGTPGSLYDADGFLKD